MILNIFLMKCISHDHFLAPSHRWYFHWACGANSYMALCFSICPSFLPYICITCYNFEVFYVTFLLLLIDFRGKGRGKERERFVVLFIDAFISWMFYVPWPGIKPSTLAYWDNVLTNWTTQPGLIFYFW